MKKKILTFQDLSCFGQCSLTAAVPILSSFGYETCALPSAVLSTHSAIEGYERLYLKDFAVKIAKHWEKLNLQFDAVYTGYLAGKEQIDTAIGIAEKHLISGGLLLVDPVMADHGRFYAGFDNAFAKHITFLCARADVITPNVTEACFLTGIPYKEVYSFDEIKNMLRCLTNIGAKKAVITGVTLNDNQYGAAYISDGQEEFCISPKIEGTFHGTGDVFAACLTGYLVAGKLFSVAIESAAAFVSACIDETLPHLETHAYGVYFEKALDMLTSNNE